jgi:hypothetical protein
MANQSMSRTAGSGERFLVMATFLSAALVGYLHRSAADHSL